MRLISIPICMAGIVACCIAGQPACAAADVNSALRAANTAYRDALETSDPQQRVERFRNAMLQYQQIVERAEAHVTAALYINLGNAALQADELGQAVLAMTRALQLDPDNSQAATNLEQARQLVPEWARWTERRDPLRELFFWNRTLTIEQVHSLAAASFLLAAVLFAARIRTKTAWWGHLALIPLMIWATLFVSCWTRNNASHHAVVLPSETMARSADATTAAPRFNTPLPSGTEVRVTQVRGDWVQADVAGKSAWLPKSSLGWVVTRSNEISEPPI